MKDESLTIKAAEVEINTERFETVSGKELLKAILPGKIEATSLKQNIPYLKLWEETSSSHHFLLMLQMAFNQHKPISITPDHIWLLICQGFSEHLKLNADSFQEAITGTDKKQTIQVSRDDFKKGWENPWEEILPAFSSQIRTRIKKELYSNLVLTFSTSTIKETTAFQISFLDSVSSYFTYEFLSLCGIPQIHLKGTKEDYLQILSALEGLMEYGLDWWINRISPTIKKFIQTFDGEEDFLFWSSIYKENNSSGGPFVTGWIADFFPYLKSSLTEQRGILDYEHQPVTEEQVLKVLKEIDLQYDDYKIIEVLIRNPRLAGDTRFQIKPDDFPSGLSMVPFKWNYLDHSYPMSFVAGFLGIRENPLNNLLQTEVNWVIRET